MLQAIQTEAEHVAAMVESAAMEAALASRCMHGKTGAEVWHERVEQWQERGVLKREYSRRKSVIPSARPRRKLTDEQRAKLPPKVETGEELIRLGESVWQGRVMVARPSKCGPLECLPVPFVKCSARGSPGCGNVGKEIISGIVPSAAAFGSVRCACRPCMNLFSARRLNGSALSRTVLFLNGRSSAIVRCE